MKPVFFGPIKLQGFGVLVCMKMDHRRGLLYKSASHLALRVHFPFPMKTVFPGLKLKHQRCLMGAEWRGPAKARVEWHRVERVIPAQSRPTQSRADQRGHSSFSVGEGPGPSASPWLCYFTVMSQLSSFALRKVSSFTTPQNVDSCWDWIGVDDCKLIVVINTHKDE